MANSIDLLEAAGACRDTVRRYLIIPDEELASCEVLRVQATSDASRQEAGPRAAPPVLDADAAPAGDIRPTLGGTPEVHVEGTIAVTKPGVVEDARWGWVREGDDPDEDLQLRQSPHVVGRRPDVLSHNTASQSRAVRPKLLSLRSGDLLAVYAIQGYDPAFARQASLLAPVPALWARVLDRTTDSWGNEYAIGIMPTAFLASYIAAYDVVQYPDTREVLLFILVQDSCVTPTARFLFTYHSNDDGVTWSERSRACFDGPVPDVVLDTDGDGDADDSGPWCCLAAELLPSGRVVLLALSEGYTWSLISDDRGASWSVGALLASHSADQTFAGHGCGSTLTRNDLAAFVVARRDTVSDPAATYMLLTPNGSSWSSPVEIASNVSTLDVAVCVSPEGWVHAYGTAHRAINPQSLAYNYLDWLWGRRLKKRDPSMADALADLIPGPPPTGANARSTGAFHCGYPGLGSGSYAKTGGGLQAAPVYWGFVSLDAVTHRGQVVLMVQLQRDATPAEEVAPQPTMSEAALVVYRLNHPQPIQELPSQAHPLLNSWYPLYPAQGMIYNRTWDAYGKPSAYGWGVAGAGTPLILGTDGGSLFLDSTAGPAAVNYQMLSIPNAAGTRDGSARLIMQADLGGSSAATRIAFKFWLANGGNGAKVTVRFERLISTTKISLINDATGASLGSTELPNDLWIEVLLATREDSGAVRAECVARAHDPAEDPDWDCRYEDVGSGTLALVSLTEAIEFGHFVAAADQSRWKGVHVSRANEHGACALVRWGVDDEDGDGVQDRATTGTGEPPLDSGLQNYMRTSRATAVPAQWVERGVSTAWRGEATTRGQYAYASGYGFAADDALAFPVVREWRSAETGKEVEIVLDADPGALTGRGFRPGAVAMLGRNFPEAVFQFHDSDSWGAPDVTWRVGYWFDAHAPQRYSHLWGFNSVGGSWSYFARGRRLTVFPPAGSGPWRPHQFRTQATGPRFYIAFNTGSTTYVYRIADNTEDTLILARNAVVAEIGVVGEEGTTFPYNFSIFSDRFAALIDHRYKTTYTGATVYPNSHVHGYRYMRILIPACVHKDEDEAFLRLGLLVLGRPFELAAPDAQWGWQRQEDSGAEVVRDDSGIARGRRRHSPRRVVSMDYSYLSPPTEMAADYCSPAEQPTRKSWAGWIDAVRRLEVDRLPAILVWEGDRAVGQTGEALVPVACDPKDLMACRLTGPGTVEHVQWEHDVENLAAAGTVLPRPSAVVRGIVFTEEF